MSAQPVLPFTCPMCGRRSWHPEDKAQGYCGACHDWTGCLATGVGEPELLDVPGGDSTGEVHTCDRHDRHEGPHHCPTCDLRWELTW